MISPTRVVALGHDGAAIDRHQTAELWMHPRAMQTLVEILPEELPVALEDLSVAVADDQVLERPMSEALRLPVEALFKGGPLTTGQIDEDEAPQSSTATS